MLELNFNCAAPFQIATLSSKDNPIRKVFDNKPVERPIEGVPTKSGRCLLEKTEKSAGIDTKKVFTIIAGNTPRLEFKRTRFILKNTWFPTKRSTFRAIRLRCHFFYCKHKIEYSRLVFIRTGLPGEYAYFSRFR